MSTVLFTHEDMVGHQPSAHLEGGGHPERPERLHAVLAALAGAGLEGRPAPLAHREDLERVHPKAFIDGLAALIPARGVVRIDADTAVSPGSLKAALRAAGAVAEAARGALRGDFDRAFCAVRPPGHHAEPAQAMGFCVFSNVAVGAKAAQSAGAERVAVVDFDVHHGNGTQAVFEADPRLYYASIHQSPLYPGTGNEDERGVGNVQNVTLPPGAPRESWRRCFESLMDGLEAFAPDIILISAGFDAHARDPLAQQNLEAEDFAWATRAISTVARSTSKGRIVSSLEGGYDLEALGRSAFAHVKALQEG